MIDLTLLPTQHQLANEFSAAAQSEAAAQYLSNVYRTGIMFDVDHRKEVLNESCIGSAEGLILWHLTRKLQPELVIETGFGRGTSSAFFLSALAPWNGRLISIDPAFRPWAGDTGLVYVEQLGASRRHTVLEQPSEIALATMVAQKSFQPLKLTYVDGSHHFDGTLMDFMYLDRLIEVGGIIGIDDASAPAVRTVASFVANNLPYRLHYPTHRLVLCQKTAPTEREWCHFRPFQSSPRSDWDVHDERPESSVVPNATFGDP